jgi:hypothetical protein
VYDYVRENSANALGGSSNVLLLRAFSQYEGVRRLHVEQRIRAALSLSPNARVETVIDQTSPRLAGQRLYEAIRHWQTCVVDLTWWRANVLFELGVRLAVQPGKTFCLIDEQPQGEETFAGTRDRLRELLRPFVYDLSTETFVAAFASPISEWIYETAAQHFRAIQDQPVKDVDATLVAAAGVAPGHDDQLQTVDVVRLYARDKLDYGEALRQSAFEQLCAAWYYLAEREAPHTARPIDLLDPTRAAAFRRFRWLTSYVRSKLMHRYERRDEYMRQRIEECEAAMKASGTAVMMDLLDAWLDLRRDPPWNIDLNNKADSDDWVDLVNDYEDQCDQLRRLEAALISMANPVCELPLQGVRSDVRRVETLLEQFRQRIS